MGKKGEVLSLISVAGHFGTNAPSRSAIFSGFGFGMGTNRFISIVNSGNDNGAAVLGLVYNSCGPSNKGVLFSNGSVAGVSRFGETGVVNHIFRSPGTNAYPSLAVLRGVTLTSGGGGPFNLNGYIGGGEVSCCGSLLRRYRVKLRSELNIRINALSNNRHRTLTLVVTGVAGVGLLVLSRRVTTLSPGSSREMVVLASGLIGTGRVAALVMARGLHFTIRCNGHLIVVRRNGTILSVGNRRGRGTEIRSLLRVFSGVDVRGKG